MWRLEKNRFTKYTATPITARIARIGAALTKRAIKPVHMEVTAEVNDVTLPELSVGIFEMLMK